jgi:hypothetical protein
MCSVQFIKLKDCEAILQGREEYRIDLGPLPQKLLYSFLNQYTKNRARSPDFLCSRDGRNRTSTRAFGEPRSTINLRPYETGDKGIIDRFDFMGNFCVVIIDSKGSFEASSFSFSSVRFEVAFCKLRWGNFGDV